MIHLISWHCFIFTCDYAQLEHVIGEAEWRTESKKCEGIIIDKFFNHTSSTDSVPHAGTIITTADGRLLNHDENILKNILYDGVVIDFENTYHGKQINYLNKNIDQVTDQNNNNQEKKISEPLHSTPTSQESAHNTIESDCEIVHPDTIIRQMILHEIHGDGLGPDWGYQDSLELLLGENSKESFPRNLFLGIIFLFPT